MQDFLDMVAIELATSNMDVIDKMHEKHIHVSGVLYAYAPQESDS